MIETLRLNTRTVIDNPAWPHIRKTSVAHLTTRYTCTHTTGQVAVAVAVKSDNANYPTWVTLLTAPTDATTTDLAALAAFLRTDLANDPASLGPTHFDDTFDRFGPAASRPSLIRYRPQSRHRRFPSRRHRHLDDDHGQ